MDEFDMSQVFYQVRALRPVTDNGVYYTKGKTFLMERSLAEAHAQERIVEILGRVRIEAETPSAKE